MKTKIMTLAVVSMLALGGCAQNGEQNAWGMGNKQSFGALGGAIAGGVLGSNVGKGKGQLLATGAGALLGAMAGSAIGKSLDQADMMYHQQAFERAYTAPINQPIAWSNPDTGHSGSVVATRQGTDTQTGNLCREYKQTIIVDGQSETAVGTACQQADGTWRLRNG